MTESKNVIRKLLAAVLCLSLLLGTAVSFGETAVSNVTDVEGPKVTNLTFKQNGKTLKPGQALEVSARVLDRSGVRYIECMFYDETTERAIWFNLDYNPETDLYEGRHVLDKSDINGTYILSDIYAYDYFSNYTNYWTYNRSKAPMGKFTLKGASKNSTSTKSAKVTVTVDKAGKTVKPETEIKVTVKVNSKLKNVSYAWVSFECSDNDYPQTKSVYCYMDEKSGKLTGVFSFGSTYYPTGTYTVKTVELRNTDGDYLATATLDNGPSVKLKSYKDTKAPTIKSAKLTEKGKTLKAGDTIHVKAKITDDSEVRSVYAYIYQNGNYKTFDVTQINKYSSSDAIYLPLEYDESSKYWVGDYTLQQDFPNGKYKMEIDASDKSGKWNYKDFSKLAFTFKDDDYVTYGIQDFVEAAVSAITGSEATEAQINDYGMKLAKGKANGVQTVKSIVSAANLSDEETVKRLYSFMKGSGPDSAALAAGKDLLAKGKLDALIDELAESSSFRTLCKTSYISAGSLTGKAEGVEIGSTAVKKVKLSQKKATLKVKKKLQLTAAVTPDNATNTKVVWTSSDTSVAKVSKKGKVTAVGKGTCVITCTAADGSGKKATCKITVK